jgi:hypothetical protein
LAILFWRFSISAIVEFLDLAALQADQVVVVPAFELEDGLARLEVVPLQQAGLLELGQHAVYRGQADVHALGEQRR